VVFQKQYDEWALELAAALKARGTRVVLDVCDNHLYNPDRVPKLAARAERLLRMLDLADAVSVSTAALGEMLPRDDAAVVDDVLDEYAWRGTSVANPARVRRSPLRLRRRSSPALSLVWFGNAGMESPSFGLSHLRKILPVLNELDEELPIRLTVISNSRAAFSAVVRQARFPRKYIEWRLDRFPTQFADHEVCVVPIELNPFTVCKTANRVALSLQLGVPVVADEIPSFAPFRAYVLFGDWLASLRRYAEDPGLRRQHAQEGRSFVRSLYTRERAVEQWSKLIDRAFEVAA
jgi:hypothetical protein